MDGVLQSRQAVLNGIANGIDMEEWDPATDKTIPRNYSARDLSGSSTTHWRDPIPYRIDGVDRCKTRGGAATFELCRMCAEGYPARETE